MRQAAGAGVKKGVAGGKMRGIQTVDMWGRLRRGELRFAPSVPYQANTHLESITTEADFSFHLSFIL